MGTGTKKLILPNEDLNALQGKLTVKHFLHTNIPSKDWLKKGRKKYPVYIRVTFQRKQAMFRSQFEDISEKRVSDPVQSWGSNARAVSESSKVQYFTEKEFDAVLNAGRKEKELISIREAIEIESAQVYGVADLLRRHNYNFAEWANPRWILDQLTHPIYYTIDHYLRDSISKYVLESKDIEDNQVVWNLLNWNLETKLIYKGILALAGKDFRAHFVRHYSNFIDLYQDLDKFILKSKRGGLCYEWRYLNLYAELNEYYDSRIHTSDDAANCHLKLMILKNSLNSYFANLGELGGRIFPKAGENP